MSVTLSSFSFYFTDIKDKNIRDEDFFNKHFLNIGKSLSVSKQYKDFNLLKPFLRLFNVFQEYIYGIVDDFGKTHPGLTPFVDFHFDVKINFIEKTSKEENLLQIEVSYYKFANEVFIIEKRESTFFDIRIDKYART